MSLTDSVTPIRKGHIRIFEEGNPSNILYENDNAICNGASWLFARMFANINEPQNGVWGLAVGAGDSTWPANNQPDAMPTQTAIITPIARKPLSSAKMVDANFNQVEHSTLVEFQTVLNATTDNLLIPIREMGLIGGGTAGTDMMNQINTPFFDPTNPNNNSAVLINYKTLPPLLLPSGINFVFSWTLAF
jgi:hypothetical protein